MKDKVMFFAFLESNKSKHTKIDIVEIEGYENVIDIFGSWLQTALADFKQRDGDGNITNCKIIR